MMLNEADIIVILVFIKHILCYEVPVNELPVADCEFECLTRSKLLYFGPPQLVLGLAR